MTAPRRAALLAFVVIFLVVGFVTFLSNSNYGMVSQAQSLKSNDHPLDQSRNRCTKIDNYKTLWNVAHDWKNFWLYFRSTTQQTNFRDQNKTIDDAYGLNNARLSDLMDESAKERKRLLHGLALSIRERIDHLQNPPDCDKAEKNVLDISGSNCGFGCVMHFVVSSLLESFLANRTFVLHSKGWRYAREGWEYTFLPLGRCNASSRDGEHTKHVGLKQMDLATSRVPGEFEPLLNEIHGDPQAWWIGQFVSYIFRVKPSMQKRFDEFGMKIGFSESTVGVHIRWGDKIGREASKHEVEEYMMFVESWFQQQENRGKIVERVVYVASEQKEAWKQLRQKYPNHKFIGSFPSKVIKNQPERFNTEGLESVITDLYFLSKCSYVVGALSSNLARAGYELMMNEEDDASTRFQSVDVVYTVQAWGSPLWEAIMDHEPVGLDEIALRNGDPIAISMNFKLGYNAGYLWGKNLRTDKQGKLPIFKIREKVMPYNETDVPKFPNVW